MEAVDVFYRRCPYRHNGGLSATLGAVCMDISYLGTIQEIMSAPSQATALMPGLITMGDNVPSGGDSAVDDQIKAQPDKLKIAGAHLHETLDGVVA